MCVSTSAPASSKTRVQDISYPVVYVDSAILIPFPKVKTKWVEASAIQNTEVKKKQRRRSILHMFLGTALQCNTNNSIFAIQKGLVGHRLVFCIHDPVCMDYQSHYQLKFGPE